MSLPTEAQWEYAARGGREQQIFTWGNTPIDNSNPQINIQTEKQHCRSGLAFLLGNTKKLVGSSN